MSAAISLPQIGCLTRNWFDPPKNSNVKKLNNFHNKVINTFSDLPQNNKIKAIAIRIFTVLIAPFAYIVLGLNVLISKIKNPLLENEIQILRNSGIITTDNENQIDLALDKLVSQHSARDPVKAGAKNHVKAIICEALEIKKTYEKDHYVFTHGQASSWFVISQLIKILVQRYDPSSNLKPFEYVRSTKHIAAHSVEGYRKAIDKNLFNDESPEARKSLISSDISLLSTAPMESALHFLICNSNILQPSAIQNVCESILRDYLPTTVSAEKISACAKTIYDLSQTIHTLCGHLFVICVPKSLMADRMENVGYLSRPFGKPWEGNNSALDECQAQLTSGQPVPPQFRLMANMLNPNLGVESFLLSTLSTDKKIDIQQKISRAVAKVLN